MKLDNSKLINYYLKDDERIQKTLRYGFDNIFIGNEEAKVANNYIKNTHNLIYGDDIDIFKNNLSDYLGNDKRNVYLFYTAHSGIYFLLSQLKKIHPNKKYVILPSFTCTVVVNAITAAGLKPIFVDIELDTYGVDYNSLKNILNDNKEEILLVIIQHLFGFVSRDYEELVGMCKDKKVLVMSDCAQSFGAFYKNKSIGLIEDFSIFSMQASKSINSYTGGILLINNDKYNLRESYNILDSPKEEDVKAILKAYNIQYLKKNKSKYILPIFNKINQKNIIMSLHKSEDINNEICNLKAHTLNNNNIYVRKYPNALATIANIQLKNLENNINYRLKYFHEFLNTYNEKIYIKKNSRPSVLRIPVIKNYEYKFKVNYENGYLVGNWFIYYFGNENNAKYAAYNLVNYLKIDNYNK